jgi:4-coumarate--CoA ligase
MSPPTTTQEPIIYTSPIASPTPHLPRRSLFTHLLGSDSHSKHGYQLRDTDLAFVDAKTGTGLTRGLLRDLALRLGYALTNAGSYSGGGGWFGGFGNASAGTGTGLIKVKRGDTIMVFSPNGLWWPLVVFGGMSHVSFDEFVSFFKLLVIWFA